jgi:hypothetical protein
MWQHGTLPVESFVSRGVALTSRLCRLVHGDVLDYAVYGEVTVSMFPPAPAEQDTTVLFQLRGAPLMGAVNTNKQVPIATGPSGSTIYIDFPVMKVLAH